jgi:hypothetical protein
MRHLFHVACMIITLSANSQSSFASVVSPILTFPVNILHEVSKDVVIYSDDYLNTSTFKQVNDFCFENGIFKQGCYEIMSFAMPRLPYSQIHISLRHLGVHSTSVVTDYVTQNLYLSDRYMEMLHPDNLHLVNAVNSIMEAPYVVYNIGTGPSLIHRCIFMEKSWSEARIINFDFLAENKFLFIGREYIPVALGAINGDVSGRWYNGDLSALGDQLFRNVTSINESDDFFDTSVYRLDKVVTDRKLPHPQVVFIDNNHVDILLGASGCMSQVNLFCINLPHTRKDYYNTLADDARSIIIENFPQFKFIGMVNYQGSSDEDCAMKSDCTADYVFQRVSF